MISQNKDSFIYIVSSSNWIWTVNRCAFWLNRYYKHSKSRFSTIVIQLFRAIETFVAVPNTKTWLLSRRTMRFSISHFFSCKISNSCWVLNMLDVHRHRIRSNINTYTIYIWIITIFSPSICSYFEKVANNKSSHQHLQSYIATHSR